MNIRKWKITDAADLANALNNKKILDNLRDGIPFPYTSADAESFINAMLVADSNVTYAWAIAAENKAIGSIGIFRRDNVHNKTAEIGYYIAEPYWGKGIVTNAVKEACNYIFKNTDIVRIFGEPYEYNTSSCRVLEKAGFVFEGILRKNAFKNNKFLDMKMYALVK